MMAARGGHLCVLLLLAGLVRGCTFDCRASVCGGPVEYVNKSFGPLPYQYTPPGTTLVLIGTQRTPILHALDLSGRGITAIAPGGLACYFERFPPRGNAEWGYEYGNGNVDASDLRRNWLNASVTQAVILDNNKLTSLPNMSSFNGTGFVSMENNSIASLPRAAFAQLFPARLSCSVVGVALQSGWWVNLQGNAIGTLGGAALAGLPEFNPGCPGDAFTRVASLYKYISIFLGNNQISRLHPSAFSNSTAGGITVSLWLGSNYIQVLESDTFMQYRGLQLGIDMSDNPIRTILPQAFAISSEVTTLGVLLRGTPVAALVNGTFSGCSAKHVEIGIENSALTSVQPGFLAGFGGMNLQLGLMGNSITSLPSGTFADFNGIGSSSVGLQNNSIAAVGAIFEGYSAAGSLSLYLSGNRVDGNGLKAALNSYRNSAGALTIDASLNNITVIPGLLFNGTGMGGALTTWVTSISLFLLQNPITTVAWNAFAGIDIEASIATSFKIFSDENLPPGTAAVGFGARISSLTIDMSSSLGQVPLELPHNLSFYGILFWNQGLLSTISPIYSADSATLMTLPYGELNLILLNTNVSLSFAKTFSNAVKYGACATCYGAHPLTLNGTTIMWSELRSSFSTGRPHGVVGLYLMENGYKSVPAGIFNDSVITELNLGSNLITEIDPAAFHYNFNLRALNLQDNNLTVIHRSLLESLPALQQLNIIGNSIRAIPETNNHVQAGLATDNIIQCSAYGPALQNCTCLDGNQLQALCGYSVCLPEALQSSGCPAGAFINSTNCSVAPWPACVEHVPPNVFYSHEDSAFLTVGECDVAFAGNRPGEYLKAYEYRPPTATSDRQCSICSTCPPGFAETPCTTVANTVCTLEKGLSLAAIVAIALGGVLLLVCAAAASFYGRSQCRQREVVQADLELTEHALGLEKSEKELMEQAWAIPKEDLSYSKMIGEGTFGRVFEGKWGHIPVAIKALRHPLDELDPQTVDDFHSEVKFMRSIRHPHILTFFGAGVDAGGRAYLVTELMPKGSLRELLVDISIPLEWPTRFKFASDVARGMVYLHSLGAVHRDLKAENCFLDEFMRVKIADFGTGRIAATMRDQHSSFTNGEPAEIHDATISSAVGTVLWMAPEALQGARLGAATAKGLDVFSFAMVMWEIWTRRLPWCDLEERGIQFTDRVRRLVIQGARPRAPENCEAAPTEWVSLMVKCWASQPEHRPQFPSIAEALKSAHAHMEREGEARITQTETHIYE